MHLTAIFRPINFRCSVISRLVKTMKYRLQALFHCTADKTIRKAMKLGIILLFATAITASATGVHSQMVTLDFQKVPVQKLFKEVMRQTGVSIVYSEKLLAKVHPASIKVKDAPVTEVMDRALQNSGLTYSFEGSTVIIVPSPIDRHETTELQLESHLPPIDVRGRVVNEAGEPVAGASIVVKSAKRGTTTNEDGYFELKEIDNDEVLVVSGVNIEMQEVPVNGKRDLATIHVKTRVEVQDEIVVNAGYYKVKERESTGSIARVSDKDIENQPVNNVLAAVQGRMAGVSITNNTGNAGGGFDISIRGKNSLRYDGNAPLIIVNGIPLNTSSNSVLSLSTGALTKGESSPLNAINPNDIESLEVLKDADATAIYGSRGANGVILITTKKGMSKDLSVDLALSTSFSSVNRFIELASTEQFKKLRKDAFRMDGISSYPGNAYDLNGSWDSSRYTDWYETFIGKSFLNQQQQLTLSGGNEQQQLRISLFNSRQGTVYGHDFNYKRSGFTLNSNFRSKDGNLRIAPSVYYTLENNNLAVADLTRQIFIAPNAPALFLTDGKLNWQNNTFENPLAQLENKYAVKTNTFSSQLLIEYRLPFDVNFRVNTGITQTQLHEFKTSPSTQYNPVYAATAQYSSITLGNTKHGNWIIEPQLNWDRKWSVHKISALVGSTFEERKNVLLRVRGSDFSSNDLLYNLSNANVQKVMDDTELTYRYQALYGRINYALYDRYIVNTTARRDGSSRFGPNNRFANFAAAGFAWIFSKESFLRQIQWLSFGKFRGSYGITGNDQIGDYQYLNTYTTGSASYGSSVGLYPSRLHNPDFSWEKTTKLEAALELGFLNDAIRVTGAWYRNRSSNQLVGIPLAATTGFTSMQQNFPATVQNTGLEMDIKVDVIRKKKFNWNVSTNISFPNSKLLEFPNIETSSYANTYEVGKSLNIRKVYEYIGINKVTGIYEFRDFNGDGKININDRRATVDYGIQFFGGLGNSFQYKKVSLQLLWQFVKQNQLDTHYSLAVPGSTQNVATYMLDYWTPENYNAKYQRPTTGANANALKAFNDYNDSDAAVVDASFIRLNSLQLNWQIPLAQGRKPELELGVQGQNLITITKFKGLEPEYGGVYLPSLRTYSISATLKF